MSERVMCRACQTRPTSAVLCKDCVNQLEEALAQLASWSKTPDPVYDAKGKRVALLSRDKTGSLPSSVFDQPGGHAMLGKTQGLAAELDVQRSRQGRRGSMNGPRLAPDSKVWWPYQGGREATDDKPAVRPKQSTLDRVEMQLARAVAVWVGRIARADHGIPTLTVTGATLGRACTLLLWHSKDITTHVDAAEAHRSFTDAATRIAKLVDRPEDRVYVGPCWKPDAAGVECVADLFAKPGAAAVQCRVCGNEVGVDERKAWLADHLEEVELTATNCSRALAQIGLEVSRSLIDTWATRGSLLSRGRVNAGGRSHALYRVGDVMLLAYKRAEDPRAKQVPA